MANSDFGIEKVVATSYWKVHAVPIGTDGKIYTVELCTGLLDTGAFKTQDQHAQFSKAELAQGRFGYLSAPEVRGLARTLRVNKGNPKAKGMVNEIREFLKQAHRKNFFLITSTRAVYNPSGEDEFIHKYGLEGQYSIKENIVGSDELIAQTKDPSTYQALFGTNDDIKEIDKDFGFLNETPTYIWRMNLRPQQRDERVVRLGANQVRFYVGCNGGPQLEDPALGGKVFAEGDAPRN